MMTTIHTYQTALHHHQPLQLKSKELSVIGSEIPTHTTPAARKRTLLHAHSHPAAPHSHYGHRQPVSSNCCLPRASFWNVGCGCCFSAIPDEILLFNVFSFLPGSELYHLAAVCSRWKFISTDPILWQQVDLSKHANVVSNDVFENVLTRVGSHVKELKLCNLKLLSSDSLERLGSTYLANNMNLRALHFCSIKSIDFSIISALLSSNTLASSLREFSLYGCVNVDDASVRLIRARCVWLQDLSLRGCIKITDQAFQEDEEQSSGLTPTVTSPKSGMSFDLNDDFDYPTSRSRSTSTNSVSSSSYSSYDDETAPVVSGRFAYLTSLNLANCKLLTEAGLLRIFQSSPLLQKLNLHGMNPSDQLLDVLTHSCPRLHTLHLSSANPFGGNLTLTDAGVEFIAQRLPHLQCLNLQGSSQLTDTSMVELMKRCHQLEKLNLGGCFKLTHATIQAICESGQSKLTHVSLFQCVHLTDASIQLLANSLNELQHLDIHSCAGLTDASIQYLLELQSPTSHLSSSLNQPTGSLDDEDLFHSSTTTSSTTSHPTHLPSTSDFYRLPHLASLDVGSCRKLTKEMIQQMKVMRPKVAVTHY